MAYRKSDNPQKRADPLGVGGKHWIIQCTLWERHQSCVRPGVVPELCRKDLANPGPTVVTAWA